MGDTLRRTAIIISLTIIIAASMLRLIDHHNQHHKKQVQRNIMDSFMYNVHSTNYGDAGTVKDTFQSKHVTHFTDYDTTHAQAPYIVAYGKNGVPWHITADQGTMSHGENNIHLQGHVNIHQPPGPKSHNVTLTTSALNYYPNHQYAETRQPVTITQPGTHIEAVGMTANLKTGDINLLHQSRGEYEHQTNTQKK